MRIAGKNFTPGGAAYVVGVVNLSPESHNRDSVVGDADAAVERARSLTDDGADIIDVGGRSSHFGAPELPWQVERDRIVPAIEALVAAGFVVSADTWDARVMHAALAAGAHLANDSDGFQSAAMIEVIATAGVPVVIPFVNGPDPPHQRPVDPRDPFAAILPYLEAALERAAAAGIGDVVVDPGLGYAVRGASQSERDRLQLNVFCRLDRLTALGCPVLTALLRKPSPDLTLMLTRLAVAGGATFLRTHQPDLVARAHVSATSRHAASHASSPPNAAT